MSPKPRESKARPKVAAASRAGSSGCLGGVGSARLMLAVHLGEVRFSRVYRRTGPLSSR